MKQLLSLAVLFTLFSCSTIKVQTEAEDSFALQNYSNYQITSDQDNGLTEIQSMEAKKLVHQFLENQGLKPLEDSNLQIELSYAVISKESRSAIGRGSIAGSGGSFVAADVPAGIEPTLLIKVQLFDQEKSKVVWSSSTTKPFRSSMKVQELEKLLYNSLEVTLEEIPNS